YKTVYAHMRKFAKGIKKGKRVKQGQVIGYVGNTGRSTGPHLHYEVIRNGKQINPKSVKSSNREKLANKTLKAFKAQAASIKGQYASLADDFEFAGN
ncbi:MAG: M23 family metallopeptidase, partial [Alphaproteobacteria bacterium]|nr:M23 family metallopeptidase [Alphaproteobacteria bacterium]